MILITGANGHIGQRLISALGAHQVRAVVRSERAAGVLADSGADVRIVDYLDTDAMTDAIRGCTHVVHLVGIIRETADTSFRTAHEETTRTVVAAAETADVQRILYLSILGAEPTHANPCLASKARAEQLLQQSSVPSLVLRVPMVLGEGDFASRALKGRAGRRVDVQFRAGSLEQPIYAGDVVAAIVRGLATDAAYPGTLVLDLAGPESLTRAALTRRAAQVLGCPGPLTVSLPLWLGLVLAGLLERFSASPPVTRAMLGVLDHDDHIDPSPALEALGLHLTSLDEMLRRALEVPPA